MGGLFAQKSDSSTFLCVLFFASDSRPILLHCTTTKGGGEMPVNKGFQRNRTLCDTSDSARPIRSKESDAFVARLSEIIGSESVSSFGRRCDIGEGVIRGYLKLGKRPGLDNLVALANAGGVLIDWLATGRGPKTRAEWAAALHGAAQEPAVYNREGIDRARLRLALVMADDAARLITEPVTPERRADLALAFYDRLGASSGQP